MVKKKVEGKFQIHVIDIDSKSKVASGLILPLRPACADVTGMRTRLCYFLTSHLMQDDETHKDIQQECLRLFDELSVCLVFLLIIGLLHWR